MRVLITGSSGLVGTRIVELLKNDFDFIPLSHSSADITNKQSIDQLLPTIDYDLLLHLAAYTNVDKAETDRENCRLLNVEGTRYLIDNCRRMGKKFVYMSTGFVFDGVSPPFDENSQANPISYYGQTKYEAEKLVAGGGMILRMEYPYGGGGSLKKDFVAKIAELVKQGKRLTMVNDSLITPTFIDDIAAGLKHLLNNFSPEIFHLVGGDSISPFAAGQMIAAKSGCDYNLIQPVSFSEFFKGKAPRPKNGIVISVKNGFHKMKTFSEGLEHVSI